MAKQFRYPGTRPFEEDDRDLFFGRNSDIEKLRKLIIVENLVVLFSKSGYGKSSLLNAGVIPRLKEVENFQTLSIRLNDINQNPVELLTFHLRNNARESNFLDFKFNIPNELKNDTSAKLWYFSKSIQLTRKESPGLVLVFDQFEELFNYTPSEVEDFGKEIASLLSPNLPERVRTLFKEKMISSEDYFTEEETDFILGPKNIKVVFSLRSDRISLLNQLGSTIPAIYNKRLELESLKEDQALEALLAPAEKKGDFASLPFTFSEDAKNLIINSLIDKDHQHIETFQLQLICQHVEELIIKNQKSNTSSSSLKVTASEIGNPEDIFENHYNTIINSLPSASQLKARILIEDKLIIGANRVPLPESVIIEEHQVPADLLKTLVDNRLLRSEPNTVGGISFELSHDTLVAPIQKTAKIRRIKEVEEQAEKDWLEKSEIQNQLRRTKILLGTAVFALAFSVIAVFFAFDQKTKAKKQAATSKALLLASYVMENIEKGRGIKALRIAEAAFISALKAAPQPPTPVLVAISHAFNNIESLPLSFFEDEGHLSSIYSVAFSPEGKFVLTGSLDNTAILWDTKGNLIQKFEGHKHGVFSVSFSPDGNSVLTGGGDNTAILWDKGGNQIQKFQGHQKEVSSVTFSPDGNSVLTGSRDKTAILWDTKGNSIHIFEGHQDEVTSVAFSPDGKSLISGSLDKTAVLWDIKGKQIQKFEGHYEGVISIAFSADGKSVLTGSQDKTAILWDTKGKQIQKFQGHQGDVWSVAFAPDGNSVLTGSLDHIAILWDLKGNPTRKFKGHLDEVTSVTFSPDGNSVLTGSLDNIAILWDIKRFPKQIFKGHQDEVTSVAFSPNGHYLLTGSRDSSAILWEINGNKIQKILGHLGGVSAVAFSPDGKTLLTGSSDNTAILWNFQGKQIQKFIGHQHSVSSVAFSQDGNTVLTGSKDNFVILWDINGNLIDKFSLDSDVSSVAFSPDESYLLIGTEDGPIIFENKRKIYPVPHIFMKGTLSVAFSPDGKSLLFGGDEYAYQVGIKELSFQSYGLQNMVSSVAFSPDGNFVLTGNWDSSAILWNTDGMVIQEFDGHKDFVNSVVVSPDGNSILTGSRDSTAILWKTPQGIFNWLQSPECPLRQLTENEKELYGIIEEND